jgi:hypothetical protein
MGRNRRGRREDFKILHSFGLFPASHQLAPRFGISEFDDAAGACQDAPTSELKAKRSIAPP